jgi:predicted ArsR family transcriptional regulator
VTIDSLLRHFTPTPYVFVVPLIQDLREQQGEHVIDAALEQYSRRREEAITTQTKPDFSRMVAGTAMFAEGGALEYEIIAASDNKFDMNVHHCQYAEMMEELGGREFGHLLVCRGDFAAAKRIGMTLTRTQTRMEGAEYCDFRYGPTNNP